MKFLKAKREGRVTVCQGWMVDACPTCRDRFKCAIVGKKMKYGDSLKIEKVVFT